MWHDIEQNSPEWFELRAGKVTGSSISKVMANYSKDFGEPAKKLAILIAVEQLRGKKSGGSTFTNSNMERGHIEEPVARGLYEDKFFVNVTNGGFFDNGNTGSSPDGIVGKKGLIEVKSAFEVHIHYERLRKNTFDSGYKWQLIFNMKEAGADWIDFVSYCPDFTEHNNLFVVRLVKEDFVKEYGMIDKRLVGFSAMVEDIKSNLLKR
jgi:hypothetical protein